MTRPSLSRFTFALLALAAGPALAQQPVVVDQEALLTQLQTLSAQLAGVQRGARAVVDPRGGRRGGRVALGQLQAALDRVSLQMQAIDQQVRGANPPVMPQCPPPPTVMPVACAPCPVCAPVVVQAAGGQWRRDERGRDHRPRPPAPIDDALLHQVLGAVNGEGFSAGKLRVLQDATASQLFTVDQLIRVLNVFSFPQDKVAALRMLAPRILDRNNQYKVYGAFTFDSDKSEAKQILDHPGS